MQHLSSAQKQVIQIAIAALLLIGCIAVLMPFTGTLLLATVICVTTAPMRNRLLRWCGGRSSLAAVLMSLFLIMLLVAPLALLVPVFGMGASALILGEPLPAWKLLAAALVMAGLAINTLWPRLLHRMRTRAAAR